MAIIYTMSTGGSEQSAKADRPCFSLKNTGADRGEVSQVTIRALQTGPPTGNIQAFICDGNDLSTDIIATSNTVAANTITTDSCPGDVLTFTFPTPTQFATNSFIVFKYTGDPTVEYLANATDCGGSTDPIPADYTWYITTDEEELDQTIRTWYLNGTVSTPSSPPGSGGTRLPPPPLIARF